MTEDEAADLSIYISPYSYGFMITDASQCMVSKEGEFATRYYGREGTASRQPMCSRAFSSKEDALVFIEENLEEKAQAAKAKADLDDQYMG